MTANAQPVDRDERPCTCGHPMWHHESDGACLRRTGDGADCYCPYAVAASPQPVDRDGIDWGVHRGSCRIFYAERRCTCGAVGEQDMLADYFATMRSIAAEDPVLLARIDRAEKAAAAAEQTGAGEEAAECNDVCEAWGCDEESTERAPSAGQDTGQMRDEIARVLADQTVTVVGYNVRTPMTAEGIVGRESARSAADALLDGPLRQLIAERDKARAQVRDAWAQTVRRSCGCWQGIGRLDPGCHRFGLCSLEISRDEESTERAPSAGQDTGQMRDALERAIHAGIVRQWRGQMRDDVALTDPRPIVRDLLNENGPLRQLIAERDKYRAQVQRVREVVEAPSSGYLDIEIRRALDPS